MNDTNQKRSQLSGRQNLISFLIGIVLASLVVLGATLLYCIAPPVTLENAASNNLKEVLLWACVGGFLGGAARSLFSFKHEMSGHASYCNSEYFKFWFIYLIKPFLGIAGGLFFFFVVNLGLVGLFSQDSDSFQFLQVAMTAVIGGMYFENVFGIMIGIVNQNSNTNR